MSVEINWDSWTPEKLIEEYKTRISKNADMVGYRMRNSARGRLRSISHPDNKRDANYRRFVASRIVHQVETEGDDVVLSIGVDGPEPLSGYYIETGSETAPAANYLRSTLIQDLPNEIGALFG